MAHIMKIAAVETTTAIWEYDPSLPDNRVLNGLLDVISAIRTVAIKVRFVLFLLFLIFMVDEPFHALDSGIGPTNQATRKTPD